MPLKEARVNLQLFTQRERKILNLIAEGYKRREIADSLNLTVRTVEKYLDNLHPHYLVMLLRKRSLISMRFWNPISEREL
jgi:DNA-binding CsgD family transcriptional regulator